MTVMLASDGGDICENEIALHVPGGALSVDGFVPVTKQSDSTFDKAIYPLKPLQAARSYMLDVVDENDSATGNGQLRSPCTLAINYKSLVTPQPNAPGNVQSQQRPHRSIPWNVADPTADKTLNTKTLLWYRYDSTIQLWEPVIGSHNDPDNGNVTAPINQAGTYALMGYSSGAPLEDISNYPNPFAAGRENTIVQYSLDKDSSIKIAIYDLFGNLVRTWHFDKGETGVGQANTLNHVTWEGCNGVGNIVANGGYILRIEADDGETVRYKNRKILVIK
jgi:hypothetical protein